MKKAPKVKRTKGFSHSYGKKYKQSKAVNISTNLKNYRITGKRGRPKKS